MLEDLWANLKSVGAPGSTRLAAGVRFQRMLKMPASMKGACRPRYQYLGTLTTRPIRGTVGMVRWPAGHRADLAKRRAYEDPADAVAGRHGRDRRHADPTPAPLVGAAPGGGARFRRALLIRTVP